MRTPDDEVEMRLGQVKSSQVKSRETTKEDEIEKKQKVSQEILRRDVF